MLLPDTIFLAGRMGAGKDAIARQLVERFGFVKIALADAVYDEVAAAEGVTVEHIKANKADYRQRLQETGHSQRQSDPLYWVRKWDDRRRATEGRVVCTDVRYWNEALYGIQTGGLVLRVMTPVEIRQQRLLERDGKYNPAWEQHPSEVDIDRLPVQAEIPGTLQPELYPAVISGIYCQMVELWRQIEGGLTL